MENLTVTCVQPFRGFLHIYGHKKPDLLDQLNAEISGYKPFMKKIVASQELYPNPEFDTIYLALAGEGTEGRFHRCTIREKRPCNKAIIDLIDYGNEYEVDTTCLLELDPKNKKAEFLIQFPPIATKYILSGFCCTWKTDEISVIRRMLHRMVLPITNEQTDRDVHFISLSFNGIDLATKLLSSQIGLEISFTEQRLQVRRQSQRLYDAFANSPTGSPARREKRRHLVPNRPLQTAINNNNNNIITSEGKRMIQNVVMSNKPNTQRNNYVQSESTVVDGTVQSSVKTAATTVSSCSAPAPSRIPAFTAHELAMGPYHAVYCSYVEDGPNLFWCQLKSQEHVLDRIASQLANAQRVPITTKVSIGMACIARFSEDQNLYRAVIQKIQSNGCRVTFIDYGNSEFVAYSELFEIPAQFLEHKTFAWSFQLSGCKDLNLTDKRLLDYFESIVCNENVLDLKVIPSNNIQVQQCELYIANGCSVLEILKSKMTELSTYPVASHLKTGDMVLIRTALNAKKLFVQRLEEMKNFDRMMDDLFLFCTNAPQPKMLPLKGSCCAAMANGDSNEWYRAIVLNTLDSQRVQVQFVDYGMEMVCQLSELREMATRFLELPCQAIECCLVDFETIADVSKTTSTQLSMLIENSNREPIPYKAQVRRRSSNGVYIVDLHDEAKDLSVSLSVYKLAMPRRPYNAKPAKSAAINNDVVPNVEKPVRPAPNHRTNGQQIMRECDGAEYQDKFQEVTNVPKDQYASNKKVTGNDNSFRSTHDSVPSTVPNAQRNDNTSAASNNYGKNRPDYDSNRRYNEQSKSVDKNDNLVGTMDGAHNINVNVSSKSTAKTVNGTSKSTPHISMDQNAVQPIAVSETDCTLATASPQPPSTVELEPESVAVPTQPQSMATVATTAPPPPSPIIQSVETPMEVEVEVHVDKTTETVSMAELVTSTDAMSIDASSLQNVAESTAEMVSMTNASATNNNDTDTDANVDATATAAAHELAFITHIDDPNRFYMQLNTDTDKIDSLHESLQIVAPQLPALTDFRAGELCIGKFSLDNCWYRARIIDTDGDITSIQFIDYGNTDSITDNALLKTANETLMAHPPFALACSLPIAPHDNTKEWTENACEKLRMLSNDTPIQFESISKCNGINYVKIYLVGGRDLVHEMIEEELADPLEIIKTGEACYVSHINSLNDFYIQVESDTDVLHKIELHLQQNNDSPILTEPFVGQICTAKFDDDQFYRARILDILPASQQYRVEFVDYGNEFVTTEVRTLNPQIAQLPYLRKRCQLHKPNYIRGGWSQEAVEEFRKMSGDGATEFKVHLMKPGKTASVELYMDDGVKVSSVLGELCEKEPDSHLNVIIDDQELSFAETTQNSKSSMMSLSCIPENTTMTSQE